MTNGPWLEPPPPTKRRKGCFAKGCLILLVLLLIAAGVIGFGGFFVFHHYREAYLPTEPVPIPEVTATTEEIQTVRTEWKKFEASAQAHQKDRIELTADDINKLIAGNRKIRNRVYVTISNNVGHVQTSIPLEKILGLNGHYLNANFTVESASPDAPAGPIVKSISLNNQSVPQDVLQWQYRGRSVRDYIQEYSGTYDISTFQIIDNKVVLETKGG
jgi:hypothetical protein